MDDNNLVGWYLLTSCAVGVAKVMLACANELRSRVAGDIGTRLHLISFYLKSLPVYLIDQDVEQLWQELLKELLRICTVGAHFLGCVLSGENTDHARVVASSLRRLGGNATA
jgi:hypothetical protein